MALQNKLIFGGMISLIFLIALVSYDIRFFYLFLVLCVLGLMLVTKKLTYFLFISPILTLALIPSPYVSAFRIQTPIGELRPSFIMLIFCLVFFTLLNIKRINLSYLRQYRFLLTVNLLFFLINLVSIIANDLPFNNFRFSFFTFVYSWGMILLVCVINDKLDTFKVFKSILVISSIVCVIGIIEFLGFQPLAPYYLMDNEWFNYVRDSGRALPRIVSTIGNPLVLAAYLLLHIPLILYMREEAIKKNRWTLILALHCLAILLTQSRSAYLILAIIIVIFNLNRLKSLIKNVFIAIFTVVFFVLLLSLFGMSDSFIDRLLFKTESESYSIRAEAFSVAQTIISNEDSLFGIGPNMVNEYLQHYSFNIPGLDNVFLNITVSSVSYTHLTLPTKRIV